MRLRWRQQVRFALVIPARALARQATLPKEGRQLRLVVLLGGRVQPVPASESKSDASIGAYVTEAHSTAYHSLLLTTHHLPLTTYYLPLTTLHFLLTTYYPRD